MITFAYNLTSWNEAEGKSLPGSMADLIGSPIQQELTSPWRIDRVPHTGHLNLYSSARSSYQGRADDVPGETSVLLSHGIADKGIRNNLSGQYDYMIAPGPLHAERLRSVGASEIRTPILGYPKLDPLFNGEVDPLPRDERIRVLYAPTQGGGGEIRHMHDTQPPKMRAARRTSWWRKDEILDALDPEVFDVVQCPHPRYTPGHVATLRQYANADVVIADGGSTLWEAMVLGLPLVVPRWITARGFNGQHTLEADLYHLGIARQATKPSNLASTVREAAAHGQSEPEARMGAKVLPLELRGTSGKTHAQWIETLVAERAV